MKKIQMWELRIQLELEEEKNRNTIEPISDYKSAINHFPFSVSLATYVYGSCQRHWQQSVP